MKKLSQVELRSLILQEINSSNKRSPVMRSSKLASLLFEQDESEDASAENDAGAPRGEAFTGQTSFKGVDAKEVAAQILTRDPEQPIFKAMEFTDDSDGEEKVVKPDPNKVADWLEGIGTQEFISRVEAVGTKIPGKGLPKSDMPFLPGPSDAKGTVEDVEDALTPGGRFNVNFESVKRGLNYLVEQTEEEETSEKELSTDPPEKNSFLGMDPDLDSGAAAEYMTAGLEQNDGDSSDDNLTINVGGTFNAQDGIPTQTNILLPKALGMAVNGVAGGNLKAYTSTENEILDGHHRWAATMLNDPGASIGTIAKIDMSKLGMDTTLKHLTAIGNALGNKTKTETYRSSDDLVMERWQRMAGLLK